MREGYFEDQRYKNDFFSGSYSRRDVTKVKRLVRKGA